MNPLVPEKNNAFVTRDMLHGNMLLLFFIVFSVIHINSYHIHCVLESIINNSSNNNNDFWQKSKCKDFLDMLFTTTLG